MTTGNPLGPVRDAARDLFSKRAVARQHLKRLGTEARELKDDLQAALDALEHDLEHNVEGAVGALTARLREVERSLEGYVARRFGGRADLELPVRAIMSTEVHTCGPRDPLLRVAQIAWEHDCGAVPVVTQDGELVGMITDRDLCMALYLQRSSLWEGTVESAMARVVYTAGADDSVSHALSIMREHRVRRLPVLDERRRLAGIVSLADVARFAESANKGDRAALAAVGATLAAITRPHRAHAAQHDDTKHDPAKHDAPKGGDVAPGDGARATRHDAAH